MKTKDPVNQELIEHEKSLGLEKLGIMNSKVWSDDPKRLVFTLSRYKFVSKILQGKSKVLEIGCGDGFCSKVVKETVEELTISDYDPLFIEKFNKDLNRDGLTKTLTHDFLLEPLKEKYDAIYTLDVLEHISKESEDTFLRNACSSLKRNGILIVGMPSIESQEFASPASKAGHINCKSGDELRKTMLEYFENVLIFSMNDEVVHTGFLKMAHYLIAIGISQK
tara:strand:- start:133 stop:801 length:669 start_codon:yes stop_codon:yes gene_type:complete